MKSLQITFGLLLLLISPCVPRSSAKLEISHQTDDEQGLEEDDTLSDEQLGEDETQSNEDELPEEEIPLDDENEEPLEEGPEISGTDEEEAGNEEGGTGYSVEGTHVQTDGQKKSCNGHEACYDQREPRAWCRPEPHQKWTDKGCFCDNKSKTCLIERYNGETREYTECTPQAGFDCP